MIHRSLQSPLPMLLFGIAAVNESLGHSWTCCGAAACLPCGRLRGQCPSPRPPVVVPAFVACPGVTERVRGRWSAGLPRRGGRPASRPIRAAGRFPHPRVSGSPGVRLLHFDFLPISHANSKRVTVASKLVSRNDSGDIRTLFLTYLSVRKFIVDFYRSKLSGWASARTSILRLGPGLPAGFSLHPP